MNIPQMNTAQLNKRAWDRAFKQDAFVAMLTIPGSMKDLKWKWVRLFTQDMIATSFWGAQLQLYSPDAERERHDVARVVGAMTRYATMMAEELHQMMLRGDHALKAIEELPEDIDAEEAARRLTAARPSDDGVSGPRHSQS